MLNNDWIVSNSAGMFSNEWGPCGEVIVAEVLAARGQLVVDEGGEHLFQLQEEPFSWLVAVGIHGKSN